MRKSTRRRLNAINQRFYRLVAEDFDRTRAEPWEGWRVWRERWGTILAPGSRVIDVGCGNGRFGEFLLGKPGQQLEYVGVDSNAQLLGKAAGKLAGFKKVRLIRGDVLETAVLQKLAPAELVGVFGVWHHIPGSAQRLRWARTLGRLVAPGGMAVWSFWQFADGQMGPKVFSGQELDLEDLEAGDWFMTWGGNKEAVRYCHNFRGDELSQVVKASGLSLCGSFLADGKNGKKNWYLVLEQDGSGFANGS